METKNFNIRSLCSGCGTCEALCSANSLKLEFNSKKGIFLPEIDYKTCNKCNLCMMICPFQDLSFNNLENENYLLGNFIDCYIGHTNNSDIRYKSASGGMVTQLLIYALNKGIIDGVIVSRLSKKNPLEPETIIARSEKEIIDASGSIYCPTPVNRVFNEVLKSNNNEKYAFVGLPCHILGLKMAQKINKKLKNRIILCFGLFCSHTQSFNGTDFLLNKWNIKRKDVQKIDYRGNGWPGKIKIELKNSQLVYIPNQSISWNAIFNSFFFTPEACLFCKDLTAELSDISFGDPWLPEIINNEKKGKSILIVRTNLGKELLDFAMKENVISLSQISSQNVIKSQKTFLFFKKRNLEDRIKIKNLLQLNNKLNLSSNAHSNIYSRLLAFVSLFNNFFGRNCGYLLDLVPFFFIKKYYLLYTLLFSLALKKWRDD